jgi:MFS family permease
MITESVPLHRRPLFAALAGAADEMSCAIAPLIGGIITQRTSWRWVFWINLPLGSVAIILIALFFTNPRLSLHHDLPIRQKIAKLDLVGTAIFVPCITSLLLALQFGGTTYGWGNVRIISLLGICLILIGAFGFYQRWMKDDATLPSRVIGQRSILSGMWFMFCNNSAITLVQYYVSCI